MALKNNGKQNSKPKIISHETTDVTSINSNEKMVKLLKDEIREYKRQIRVLKRTIENLKTIN
jgi:predicted RNase H-like nuclease (RuvC/YqgF family)